MENELKNYSEKQLLKAETFFKDYIKKIHSLYGIVASHSISAIFRDIIAIINNTFTGKFKVEDLSKAQLKLLRRRYREVYRNIESLLKGNNDLYYNLEHKLELTDVFKEYLFIAYDIIREKMELYGYNTNTSTGKLELKHTLRYPLLEENHPLKRFINSDLNLVHLNRQRKRNVILYDNNSHQIIYDLLDEVLLINPKIPFSDFEHDNNRKFTERICIDFLYNFEKKRDYFLKLLNQDKILYNKEISIVEGKEKPSGDDLLVLISLLGRLDQQNKWGPISVFKKDKLYPNLIQNHSTNLEYIKELILTLEGYRQLLHIDNSPILQLSNVYFDVMKTDIQNIMYYIEPIKENKIFNKSNVSTNKRIGNVESPNYLESFFRKFSQLDRFEDVVPYLNNNEDLVEWIDFTKRYMIIPTQPDFITSGKIRAILSEYSVEEIVISVHDVYDFSKKNTYSKKVAKHLINLSKDILSEFYRLYFIFNTHIERERLSFIDNELNLHQSNYNDNYLSITSDMHFNNLQNYEKSNFSSNFNVVAGDFTDNLYHRGNAQLEGCIDIHGIGVLGNHDIYLSNDTTFDLTREIKSNYKKSIYKLKKSFPNIKILNDEILYKDGYAIIGITLVYDIDKGVRTFFANEEWGNKFANDDYIKRAEDLLDKVPSDIPIVFISHSPFKEYAVCSNKTIGVPSDKIFKNYPNVKVYIHGHGHSLPNKKIIDGVLCITNPIILGSSISEVSFSLDEIYNILGLDSKKIKMLNNNDIVSPQSE